MKQRGVTLPELVICLGIFAILMSAALLVLGQSLHKQELENACLLLATDLRWLQQLSINAGYNKVSYILQFNLDEPCGYYITANTKLIKKHIFPRGIRLYAPYPLIGFGLSGVPLKGAQTISLESNSLHAWKYVVLAPVTGRVRISNTRPSQAGDSYYE